MTVLCIFVLQLVDKLKIPVGQQNKVKDVQHLSQNTGNNFVHFTEQTGQRGPTVFRKCWARCNMEWMLFFKNMGKVEGEAEGCHYDYSIFILMLVFLFVSWLLLLLLLLLFSLSVRFFLFLHFREQPYYGWNMVLHYLFVFAFVSSRSSFVQSIISAPVEIIFKGHWSRPTPLSSGNKRLQCNNEMVSHVIVWRESIVS